MSTENSTQISRKSVSKKLSTGQRITLTPQDDRTLKYIYDFVSGYSKRKQIEASIEIKKREVEKLNSEISPAAKLLMKERVNLGNISYMNDDSKLDGEIKVDEYYKAKEQFLKLEERLKLHVLTDHKISFKDIDAVVRSLGTVLSKKQIEVFLLYLL